MSGVAVPRSVEPSQPLAPGPYVMVPSATPESAPPPGFTTVTLSAPGFGPFAVAAKPTLSRVNASDGSATTVMRAAAVSPPAVAVIVSVPLATAFTRPIADTVANAGLRDLHAVAAPTKAWPFWSRATAWSTSESPTVTVAVSGKMTSAATAGGEIA